MLRNAGIATALVLTATFLAGCPKEPAQQSGYYPPPQPGYQQPGYPQPGYPQPGYPDPGYQQPGYPPQPTAPYPTQPAPYPTYPGTTPAPTQPAPQPSAQPGWPFPFPFPTGTQPAPAPQPGGQPSGNMAQPIDPNVAQAATIPLMAVANDQARGMRELTPIVAAQFQPGQVMEAAFQLSPGRCYTVIAVGQGITEMDIQIVLLQPIPGVQNPSLAQDNSSGATAVLGGGGNCYKWPFPVGANAKAVFTAVQGSGIAAGRVYEK